MRVRPSGAFSMLPASVDPPKRARLWQAASVGARRGRWCPFALLDARLRPST